MTNSIVSIFYEVWPMIVICSVILVVLRIGYLLKNHQKFVFYKEVFMFIFVIYMMCLFYVVSFQDIDGQYISGYNLIPFKEMFRYHIGSRLFFKNVIGNLFMFVPFGFFSAYILRDSKLRWTLLVTLIVSVTIELIQSQIGRVFDVDDIILNAIGGIIGYKIFSFCYHFNQKESID